MDLNALFESFVRSGKFLKDWSPKTERSYRQAFASFTRCNRDAPRAEAEDAGSALTRAQLEAWVVWMRQRGMLPGGCNVYIRGMNSFLSWLHAERHTPAHLRLRPLRHPAKALATFSDDEIRGLLTLKPEGRNQLRAWVLVLCLIDTGIRIDEALGLEQKGVNLDEMSMTVLGKGAKERTVFFSHPMRKHLFRLIGGQRGTFVFQTRDGQRLSYRNASRDLKLVCERAGITGDRVHPHAFRHFFAVNFIRGGGDIYRLSRILGHTSIATTQLYLRSMSAEQVGEAHRSPLTPRL